MSTPKPKMSDEEAMKKYGRKTVANRMILKDKKAFDSADYMQKKSHIGQGNAGSGIGGGSVQVQQPPKRYTPHTHEAKEVKSSLATTQETEEN